jgi:hypothetical protein
MNTRFLAPLSGLVLVATLAGGTPAQAATLPAPVPNAIVSASSSWGTASDSWAGYTGVLQIWVPDAVSGGWTLTFQSAGLGRQAQASSFWNANAVFDPVTNTFTLTSPSWGGDVAANSVLDVGFNASGAFDTSVDLANCKFNGQPCVISAMTSQSAQQTLANLKAGYQGGGSATPTPAPSATPSPSATPVPVAGPKLEVLFSISSSWDGGYSGNVAVKNLSSKTLKAGAAGWQAPLKFPDAATAQDVFKSGPWNFSVNIAGDGTATLKPKSWAAALAPGDVAASGFNGGSPANLQKAAAADSTVTVLFAPSVPNSNPTPTPNPTATPSPTATPAPTPVASATPSPSPTPVPTTPPTGGAGSLLFSPYKDVTISMNWNSNVMSTAVTGTPSPLLSVLPAKVPAVTWAFATGECGKENWAGIQPDVLVQANLQAFVDTGIDYVVSTGGAAGAFTCSSEAGMRAFIDRYASSRLVGIDFDIEAGQSQAAIASLVRQVAAVQSDYPNLRFSFTVATLGSSDGTVTSTPYGDLNVTGYNVVKAVQQYGIANYTINLMVMDYGTANAGNCVVVNGKCDMGQTAIQAAKNLKARYGIPYERIELTPMIGVNDVSDELFSLQDTGTMVQWALANGIAGLHFWSADRDTPCSQTSASPICSSVPSVPAWGYTNRFIGDLGL